MCACLCVCVCMCISERERTNTLIDDDAWIFTCTVYACSLILVAFNCHLSRA